MSRPVVSGYRDSGPRDDGNHCSRINYCMKRYSSVVTDPAVATTPTDPSGTTTGRSRPRHREEERVVRRYLEALQTKPSRRGPHRSPDTLAGRLRQIDQDLAHARSVTRLLLLQERRDLEAKLERSTERSDFTRYEQEFIRVARAYGERQGIAYSSWRALGVRSSVLAKAKIIRPPGRPKADADGKAGAGGKAPARAAPQRT